MKNLKPRIILFITIACILSSCKDDVSNNNASQNSDENSELVGVWQRSDFIKDPDFSNYNENNDYKLHFNTDNSSSLTHGIFYSDGKAISTANTFEWSTENNQLSIKFSDEEVINTPYSINEEGQLLLNGLTNLPFNKISE